MLGQYQMLKILQCQNKEVLIAFHAAVSRRKIHIR
jgi:hypothetical protein